MSSNCRSSRAVTAYWTDVDHTIAEFHESTTLIGIDRFSYWHKVLGINSPFLRDVEISDIVEDILD
jgi:hypothetical protein